jgi:hypothetical protein
VRGCLHLQLVASFAVPGTVTTDRGTQFTSALWSSTCTSLGIKHVLTTAYHPQSNGMVERVHRQFKDALCARGAGPAWHSHLPWVLLGLGAAPKEDSACLQRSWFWDTTGSSWTAPARAISSTCGRATASHEAAVLCGGGQHTAGSLSQGGAHVRAGWRPAEAAGSPYAGPYLVVSKGAKTFTIQVGQRQEIASVDRLKPHTGLGPVSPAEAASRGRPPRLPAAPSVQPASS